MCVSCWSFTSVTADRLIDKEEVEGDHVGLFLLIRVSDYSDDRLTDNEEVEGDIFGNSQIAVGWPKRRKLKVIKRFWQFSNCG